MVIFLSKGFNLFINADTDWSKKLAAKLERTRFAEVLEEINSTIIRLDIEIDKLNKELELAGVDVDDLDIKSEMLTKEDKIIKRTEDEIIEDKKSEVKKTVVKKAVFEQKTSDDVDDLLSALDSLGLSDDEDDEFENSSELWKKDSKILR